MSPPSLSAMRHFFVSNRIKLAQTDMNFMQLINKNMIPTSTHTMFMYDVNKIYLHHSVHCLVMIYSYFTKDCSESFLPNTKIFSFFMF